MTHWLSPSTWQIIFWDIYFSHSLLSGGEELLLTSVPKVARFKTVASWEGRSEGNLLIRTYLKSVLVPAQPSLSEKSCPSLVFRTENLRDFKSPRSIQNGRRFLWLIRLLNASSTTHLAFGPSSEERKSVWPSTSICPRIQICQKTWNFFLWLYGSMEVDSGEDLALQTSMDQNSSWRKMW